MKKETDTPTLPQNSAQPIETAPENAQTELSRPFSAESLRRGLNRKSYTLEKTIAIMQAAQGPQDFKHILCEQARILNAGFEYYLTQASFSREYAVLALRMQAQLTRTIDTWRRLENFQNEQTK